MEQLVSHDLDDLGAVAARVISFAGEEKVWLFIGEMGVGKTTLIQRTCKALGVKDAVQSPTFSIVNEYLCDQGDVVYHFDFYRVAHIEEALDIGVEEYFSSGNICMIEWPERVGNAFTG